MYSALTDEGRALLIYVAGRLRGDVLQVADWCSIKHSSKTGGESLKR